MSVMPGRGSPRLGVVDDGLREPVLVRAAGGAVLARHERGQLENALDRKKFSA